MITQESIIHSSFDAKNVAPLKAGVHYTLDEYKELYKVGIGGLDKIVNFAMDTIQQPLTTPSVGTPVQFLQNWLPGLVEINTAKRAIDEFVGIATVGSWEDEQVVQGVAEPAGTAVPYGDLTNIPLSDYNINFNYRNVVRFEIGMRVGALESARVSRMRVSADAQKRGAAALSLNITRNQIGFYGYNNGNNNTYGFLNDPSLPSYQTVATGAVSGSKLWAVKTMPEITADILAAVASIVTTSQDTINPENQATTLAIPTNCIQYLNKINDFGISAKNWINQTYPMMRIVSAPQLNNANGNANVFYLYADQVNDTSSDDRKTFIQIVPAQFQVLGVQQLVKAYEEGYSNATAGVMCKRPYAVYRGTGI